MKRSILLAALSATVLGAAATPAAAQSSAGAQIIFANDKLTVIDARGVSRSVGQGDFVQAGERVLVPPGVMGQIRLPDGTLLGARPDSNIQLESISPTLGKSVVVLNDGNLRVVNVAPPNGPAPKPIDIVSPASTLQLTAGDGEMIHVAPGGKSGAASGTYNRLQQGSATVGNDRGQLPLPPMQAVFSPRTDIAPTQLAALPPGLQNTGPIRPLSPTSTPLQSPLSNPAAPPGGPTSARLPGTAPTPFPSLTPGTPIRTIIGSASPTGTTAPAISPTITPNYAVINPQILATSSLRPPPPPPPAPPMTLTCKTCPTTQLPPTTTVIQPPPSVTQPPTTVVQPPATVIQPPTTVIPPPTTVIQPPTTVIPPPTTVIQPPTTVIPPPTTVIQPPTTVIPPPTTVIQPPTTIIVPPTITVLPPRT